MIHVTLLNFFLTLRNPCFLFRSTFSVQRSTFIDVHPSCYNCFAYVPLHEDHRSPPHPTLSTEHSSTRQHRPLHNTSTMTTTRDNNNCDDRQRQPLQVYIYVCVSFSLFLFLLFLLSSMYENTLDDDLNNIDCHVTH